MELKKFDAHIGGEKVPPANGEYFETINPFTSQAWGQVARCSQQEVDLAVAAASTAFEGDEWSGITPSQRGALLRSIGDILTDYADELAQLEVRDNGKLISEMAVQCAYIP